MANDVAVIKAGMAALARRKWLKMTPEQQAQHIRLMVAARLKRKHRQAKVRARG